QAPSYSNDTLRPQPTIAIRGIPHSYTYQHSGKIPLRQDMTDGFHPNVEHAMSPQAHHDAYSTEPYQPTVIAHPGNSRGSHGLDLSHHWQNDEDTRPMLESDDLYKPFSNQTSTGVAGADDEEMACRSAPSSAQTRRWKMVQEVRLFEGNLVLDCPVPPRLLNQISQAQPLEREVTHMRYSAVTCDPSEFYNERFTLRQRLFAKPRHSELFIVVTMYNEEDELFARTMSGVIKNIEHMNSRTKSNIWGEDAWKKVVVCIVSDGRAKINPRTRAVLAGMGVYQDCIAKQQVNGKDVTAHIYEYTTQMTLDINRGVVQVKKGNTPVQILFCLKEMNQKKINSHRWFFQAFGSVLNPNICVLIDAGTKPGTDSVYKLWKIIDREPMCAGACGEIKALLDHGKNLVNPLVAAQNFEYKMSNILDKPLESVFGFISVLPGAFSAYRYIALQNDKTGQGPLEKHFAGEKMHGANAGIFTANVYLAEDRILCFELVSKRNCSWTLQYVKSATGETDVPTEMADFILQRRRWLNGSFFAAVYALTHFYQIFRSGHSIARNTMFLIEFTYQAINMVFAWFAIGNFFLVFRILTTSLSDSSLNFAPGQILSVIFEWLYLATLVTCFVLALGNRPQGSNRFYMIQVYFWASIMAYLIFATVFITVKSVQVEIEEHGFTLSDLFTNSLFLTLIVSMASTYILYFVVSFLFLDPWHMFTSFLQYLLMTPTYINILNVYAFCNTHDNTWGTKGEDKPERLPTAIVNPSGTVDVAIPDDETDLNSQYEAELAVFATSWKPPKKEHSAQEKHEDYYRGIRSTVVLAWMFCNLALAAVVLNAGGLDRIRIDKSTSGQTKDEEQLQRSTLYMAVVLWTFVKNLVKDLVKSLPMHQQQEPNGHHKHAYHNHVHSDLPSQQTPSVQSPQVARRTPQIPQDQPPQVARRATQTPPVQPPRSSSPLPARGSDHPGFSNDESHACTGSELLHYRLAKIEEVNKATSRTISSAVENHKALQDQTVKDRLSFRTRCSALEDYMERNKAKHKENTQAISTDVNTLQRTLDLDVLPGLKENADAAVTTHKALKSLGLQHKSLAHLQPPAVAAAVVAPTSAIDELVSRVDSIALRTDGNESRLGQVETELDKHESRLDEIERAAEKIADENDSKDETMSGQISELNTKLGEMQRNPGNDVRDFGKELEDLDAWKDLQTHMQNLRSTSNNHETRQRQ
ncbi:glycosyltransferase family 2 protein, partial [Aureobasidium melanogenum]